MATNVGEAAGRLQKPNFAVLLGEEGFGKPVGWRLLCLMTLTTRRVVVLSTTLGVVLLVCVGNPNDNVLLPESGHASESD